MVTRKTRDVKFQTPAIVLNTPTESVEDLFSQAKLAAARGAYLNAPAVRALKLILLDDSVTHVRPGQKMTMGVDKWYRCYTTGNFIREMISDAEAVSSENPCLLCGDSSHHRLAYLAGVIVHEAWHLVRRHAKRSEANQLITDLLRWNIAADLELDDDIIEMFKSINNPRLCLPPWMFYPAGMRAYPAKAKKWEKSPLKSKYQALYLQSKADPHNKELFNAREAFYDSLPLEDKLNLTAWENVSTHGEDVWASITDGRMAESYYRLLPELPKGDEGICGIGSYDHGSGVGGELSQHEHGEPGPNNPGISEAEGKLISKSVANNIKNAAKNNGHVPAGLARWADLELGESRYDWRKELSKALRWGTGQTQGSSIRSFRRFGLLTHSSRGRMLYPTSHDPTPNVTVVFDTSGSMGEQEARIGLTETDNLLKSVGATVRFTAVDAEATQLVDVASVRDIKFVGGGGTDMRVGINQALSDKGPDKEPAVIVVMTDGYTPWPNAPLNKGRTKLIVCLCGKDTNDLSSVPAWALGIKITEDDSLTNEV